MITTTITTTKRRSDARSQPCAPDRCARLQGGDAHIFPSGVSAKPVLARRANWAMCASPKSPLRAEEGDTSPCTPPRPYACLCSCSRSCSQLGLRPRPSPVSHGWQSGPTDRRIGVHPWVRFATRGVEFSSRSTRATRSFGTGRTYPSSSSYSMPPGAAMPRLRVRVGGSTARDRRARLPGGDAHILPSGIPAKPVQPGRADWPMCASPKTDRSVEEGDTHAHALDAGNGVPIPWIPTRACGVLH